MLTLRRIEEIMYESLQSPLSLCDRLGLTPTTAQFLLLEPLAREPEAVDVSHDSNFEAMRAVAMYALWRVLHHTGSHATVVAATTELADHFADFLGKVTLHIDPALAGACKWSKWNVVQIGPDPGQEIRIIPSKPACARGRDCGHHTIVVLGSSSETEFAETVDALTEGSKDSPGVSTVRLW